MDKIKRLLGYIWIILGPLAIITLLWGAITNINAGDKDIHKPLPWIIIISIFTPIAIGLTMLLHGEPRGWARYTARNASVSEIVLDEPSAQLVSLNIIEHLE